MFSSTQKWQTIINVQNWFATTLIADSLCIWLQSPLVQLNCFLVEVKFMRNRINKNLQCTDLRVVDVLSENIKGVINPALEIRRVETFCQGLPPAQIHQIADVLIYAF